MKRKHIIFHLLKIRDITVTEIDKLVLTAKIDNICSIL